MNDELRKIVQSITDFDSEKRAILKLIRWINRNETDLEALITLALYANDFHTERYYWYAKVATEMAYKLEPEDFEILVLLWYTHFHYNGNRDLEIIPILENFPAKNNYEKSLVYYMLGHYSNNKNDSKKFYINSLRLHKFPKGYDSLASYYLIYEENLKKYKYYMGKYFQYIQRIFPESKDENDYSRSIRELIDFRVTGIYINQSFWEYLKDDMNENLKGNTRMNRMRAKFPEKFENQK
jgi:hypothetical protein